MFNFFSGPSKFQLKGLLAQQTERAQGAERIIKLSNDLIDGLKSEGVAKDKLIGKQNDHITALQSLINTLEKHGDSLIDQVKNSSTHLAATEKLLEAQDKLIKHLNSTVTDQHAYLSTLAKFGGTLDQARDLAGKAVIKHEPTVVEMNDFTS